tara:strand:- start:4437 stop:4643 length:207 start_codon:yes stop_codon:yes gene_type:complete
MTENINEVEFALGYSGDSWSKLEFLGQPFYNMDSAIEFIRSTYDSMGITTVRLRQVDSTGSISEWDNF